MDNTIVPPLYQVAEVALIYRNKVKPGNRPWAGCASRAYKILKETWDMNRIELVEQFKILLLDDFSACLGLSDIASGGVSECIADPKIVFATALKSRATQIILAHNHPTGNLAPSHEDIAVTAKMMAAGNLLDITIRDHLIIGPHTYFSFVEGRLMPEIS